MANWTPILNSGNVLLAQDRIDMWAEQVAWLGLAGEVVFHF